MSWGGGVARARPGGLDFDAPRGAPDIDDAV